MNAAQVIDHFDRLCNAPDAIPRLRRFILDLAVRGKLVEQDPNDEPASELLKRIEEEKLLLIGRGRLKKQEKLSPVSADELTFDVPGGWAVTRLAVVAVCLDYMREPINSAEREQRISGKDQSKLFPYFGATQQQGWIDDYIFDEELVLLGEDGVPFFDDLRPKAYVISGKTWVNNHTHVFRGILVSNVFLSYSLNTFDYSGRVAGATRSKLNQAKAVDIPIILPPLAEQHRIVAKVDELMALCDRLEAAQTERESRRDKLAAASLHRLNNGADADEFREHTRFHLHHLPRLTTRPEHIQQLRQTILNLAVRGKLVPQDPNDEAAFELLKRIDRTRAHLYAEGKIPKPKNLPVLESVEIPFKLGSGWEWTMLGKLCYQVSDGPHHSPRYVTSEAGVPFLSTRNVRADRFDLSDLKYVSKEDHERFCQRIRPEPEDILYTKGGTTGIARVNDLDFEFSVWVHVAVLRIAKKFLVPRYVAMALNSPLCYEQSQAYTQGISNYDLGLTRMIKILMPLPPLAEQHRIVAKVDELMTLCDRLETQLTTTQTETRHFLEAVFQQALN